MTSAGRQSLALPAGEVDTTLGDTRLQPVYKVAGRGDPQRSHISCSVTTWSGPPAVARRLSATVPEKR